MTGASQASKLQSRQRGNPGPNPGGRTKPYRRRRPDKGIGAGYGDRKAITLEESESALRERVVFL